MARTQRFTIALPTCLMVLVLVLELTSTIEAGVVNLTTSKTRPSDEYAIMKCRQRCFSKTLDNFQRQNTAESVKSCRKNPDCFMCFDYCHVLAVADRDLSQSMCNDNVFCSKGCRTACNFHRIKSMDTLIYELINNS